MGDLQTVTVIHNSGLKETFNLDKQQTIELLECFDKGLKFGCNVGSEHYRINTVQVASLKVQNGIIESYANMIGVPEKPGTSYYDKPRGESKTDKVESGRSRIGDNPVTAGSNNTQIQESQQESIKKESFSVKPPVYSKPKEYTNNKPKSYLDVMDIINGPIEQDNSKWDSDFDPFKYIVGCKCGARYEKLSLYPINVIVCKSCGQPVFTDLDAGRIMTKVGLANFMTNMYFVASVKNRRS
jgi:hypothetical protein